MTNIRKNILLVLPAAPYPLRENGVGMRYMPIIDYLAENYSVDLVLFGDCNQQQKKWLEDRCANVHTLKVYAGSMVHLYERAYLWFRFLLPWTAPISYSHYRTQRAENVITEIINTGQYKTIIWASAPHAEFLLRTHKKRWHKRTRLIVDLVDSMSLHAERDSMGHLRNKLLDKYERWKIKKLEANLIKLSDVTIYISDVDAQAIPASDADSGKRYVIPNGLYIGDYNSEKVEIIRSPSIGFLGNMSYKPNVDAVLWFYNNIFSELVNIIPELTLCIIGREPAKPIVDLGNLNGIFVTGTVESIWPFVNSVDLFVVPLNKGAGLKNKVLDVMFAAKPVVSSIIGNEGIYADDGKEIVICSSREEYIGNIVDLLADPDKRRRIGDNAKEFVCSRFAWPVILKNYTDTIDGLNSGHTYQTIGQKT